MSDPMTWAVPVGRYFGIRVRIHLLFILLTVPYILKPLLQGDVDGFAWAGAANAILFFSVLFHEFGHCFAARAVGGDAEEILMWPLGGLAYVSVPNTARANFISTVWGPLINVIICAATAVVLVFNGLLPPLNPVNPFAMESVLGEWNWLTWVGHVFGLNWLMLLFNMIPAYPMDAGRMLRCALWVRIGFGRATLISVQVAKLCAIAMGVAGFILMMGDSKPQGLQLVCIAFFVYVMSDREKRMLEAGMLMDDSVFGYDFSQGYTSLAHSQPKSSPKRIGAWERWRRRRERLKRQRELATKQEEERKVDEILAKLHREGMASLTDQERRFLTRTSEKYRSRNRTD
jgi:Zn-dependent protease